MKIDPFTSARQLELLADEVYDLCCETLGQEHQVTFKTMQIMARAFAHVCDLEGYMRDVNEPESFE